MRITKGSGSGSGFSGILWKLGHLWKSQSSWPVVKVKPTQPRESSPGLSVLQSTGLYCGLKSCAFFLSIRIQKADGKPDSSLFLWNVFFYFTEVKLSCASLCKFRKSFVMLWRSSPLLTTPNGPKDVLSGFVFLRLSYISIVHLPTSLPCIIPKYIGEEKHLSNTSNYRNIPGKVLIEGCYFLFQPQKAL